MSLSLLRMNLGVWSLVLAFALSFGSQLAAQQPCAAPPCRTPACASGLRRDQHDQLQFPTLPAGLEAHHGWPAVHQVLHWLPQACLRPMRNAELRLL